MNKLAFYGYFEFFNKDYGVLEDNFENEDLLTSIMNGCYRNYKFAELAIDLLYDYSECLYANCILIANNSMKFTNIPTACIYHDFNYPDIYHSLIFKDHRDLTFLCILNDWKDIYDKQNHKKQDYRGYSLALYLNKEYYINHQRNLKSEKDIDDSYFFYHLNTNIRLRDYNLFPYETSGYESDYEFFNESEYIDNEDKSHIDNVNKYEIVNNFDIAYKLYLNGDKSNLVLSKIINTDPKRYRNIFEKYKPFLIFTRNEFSFYEMNKFKEIYPFSIYNITYINIIVTSVISAYISTNRIEIPEYNLYVIAKKLRNKKVLKKILELYKKHGKLYKIMDLENECYIDPPEEIFELPDVKNIDLFTGDELNPYINVKLT